MGNLGYDILRKDSGGGLIWVEAVADLPSARGRVMDLAAGRPGVYGVYIVFSQWDEQVVAEFTLPASGSGNTCPPDSGKARQNPNL
jgi:hypothetical protein